MSKRKRKQKMPSVAAQQKAERLIRQGNLRAAANAWMGSGGKRRKKRGPKWVLTQGKERCPGCGRTLYLRFEGLIGSCMSCGRMVRELASVMDSPSGGVVRPDRR